MTSTTGTSYEPGDLVWLLPCTIDGERTAAVVAGVEDGVIDPLYTLQIGGVRRAPLYEGTMLAPRDRPAGDWD